MPLFDFEATVSQITDYPDGEETTRVLRLKVPDNVPFSFTAGQWAFLYHDSVKKTDDPTKPKMGAFSIASAPSDLKEKNLDFCIKAETPTGISYFVARKLKVGDKIKVKGPFGHYAIKPEYDHYYFVSTGTGIAPYISMTRELIFSGSKKKITIIFGFRRSAQYMYRKELEEYAKKYSNIELIPTISRDDPEWKGHRGYVQTVIPECNINFEKEKCALYVCGSKGAIDGVKQAAIAKGFLEKDIYIEKWN